MHMRQWCTKQDKIEERLGRRKLIQVFSNLCKEGVNWRLLLRQGIVPAFCEMTTGVYDPVLHSLPEAASAMMPILQGSGNATAGVPLSTLLHISDDFSPESEQEGCALSVWYCFFGLAGHPACTWVQYQMMCRGFVTLNGLGALRITGTEVISAYTGNHRDKSDFRVHRKKFEKIASR